VLIVAPPLSEENGENGDSGHGEKKKKKTDATTVRVEAISRDPAQPFIERQLVGEIVRLHREYEKECSSTW
jgi:hypothetical protein